MKKLEGIGVSPGIAIAPAFKVDRSEISVASKSILPKDVDNEIKRFRIALKRSEEQLLKSQANMAKMMGDTVAKILEAQILILSDSMLIDEAEALIKYKLLSAETAFDSVINRTIEQMENSENTFFVERAQDLADVRRRVLSNLTGATHHLLQNVENECVLVIQHLAPSETAHLYNNRFVGLAIEMGGTTSHVAIMTRTMEIPCVLGLVGVQEIIISGQRVIVDGSEGVVILEPDADTLRNYDRKRKEYVKKKSVISRFSKKPAITKDGHKISVGANLEIPGEIESVVKYGADGVGLFRTELLYTESQSLPDEEDQTAIYSRLADRIAPHPLVVRTFDIGGDKFSELLDTTWEPNPFLGWRAVRIGLDRPHIFKTQIRAILRSAYRRNIKAMIPMISNKDEVLQTRALFDESRAELIKEGFPVPDKIELGIMVEIPSVAILAREIAPEVDFFSIGTNDLIQYTLAVDRGNRRVSRLYQSFNPAVLKLIQHTINSAHAVGIWCGLCGEMAADPRATVMLVGMGLDEFSVTPPAVPLIKGIISSIDEIDARKVARECTRFATQEEVVRYLDKKNSQLIPEELLDLE